VVYEMGTVEDSSHKIVMKPTIVGGLLGLSISQICCGGQHAAVLTQEGIVHTWGRGGFGRLGHGKLDGVEYPREVVSLKHEKCVQIACGFAYTAAVTDEGILYTWGAGENGRLGLGDAEDRHVPCRVEELVPFPVHQVCCNIHIFYILYVCTL
jgi:E3 ubiquitin-protein ligase HERC2